MGKRRKSEAENYFQLGEAAAEAENHEEAYRYFTKVLEADPKDAEAWLGKAVAAGWQSNLRGDRLGEMTAGIGKALALVGDGEPQLSEGAANKTALVVLSFFGLSVEHTQEFITVDSAWPEHVERGVAGIRALKEAGTWDADNMHVLEARLTITDALLTGMEYRSDDEGNYEYLHVSDDLKSTLHADRSKLIDEIKAIDPSFVAEDVKPVKGPGCGCQIAAVVMMLAVGFAIIM